ncbi:MAG TPA: hypothetical protein GX503_00585 [Clostridiales bacterium]|nr:hypothetical protein [Clostridiales bacterium]
MREFKFRAWDGEARRMYSPEDLEQPEIKDDTKKTIYGYLSFGVLYIYDFKGKEPVELVPMQFTGWYDKKQNEIYEGDIVNIEGVNYEVIWSEESAAFMLQADRTTAMGGEYLNDVAEVVGNIYENPEYLENPEYSNFQQEKQNVL